MKAFEIILQNSKFLIKDPKGLLGKKILDEYESSRGDAYWNSFCFILTNKTNFALLGEFCLKQHIEKDLFFYVKGEDLSENIVMVPLFNMKVFQDKNIDEVFELNEDFEACNFLYETFEHIILN